VFTSEDVCFVALMQENVCSLTMPNIAMCMNMTETSASPRSLIALLRQIFTEHNPRFPHVGLAGAKQFLIKVFAAFSDYHGEVRDLVAEGNKVVSRIQWTGTNDGPYEGRPATGNKLVFSTSDFSRISQSKFHERYATRLEHLSPEWAISTISSPLGEVTAYSRLRKGKEMSPDVSIV
jgi:predicted ester cyclase